MAGNGGLASEPVLAIEHEREDELLVHLQNEQPHESRLAADVGGVPSVSESAAATSFQAGAISWVVCPQVGVALGVLLAVCNLPCGVAVTFHSLTLPRQWQKHN